MQRIDKCIRDGGRISLSLTTFPIPFLNMIGLMEKYLFPLMIVFLKALCYLLFLSLSFIDILILISIDFIAITFDVQRYGLDESVE